jgi:hypothetical protein
VKDEMTTEEISNGTSNQDLVEKKEKKPKKALAEGMKTGTYDADEEARFLEGLELFGREWTKVFSIGIKGYPSMEMGCVAFANELHFTQLAAHIGTRDPNSLRSHAQKHFIKLYRDNIPLPDKVRHCMRRHPINRTNPPPYG